LIYKLIHDFKINARNKPNDGEFTQPNFDDVKTEVAKWVETTSNEISSLKNLEEYRRNFLGNISHELKTPIFSIQGYLYTLLDGGLADEKINLKYLRRAAANVERLETIVEDLEIINKLEWKETSLQMEAFDIRKLSKEVMSDLQFKAKENKIKLSIKEGANSPFPVYADRHEIRRVLNNLMINAIKYGKEKGWVKLSFYDMDERVLIEISDNGIGIAENHLKHLFDRFYRVDPSRSRALGGSGLGLSIVKHIIEAHNETINVRSTPEVGSTFGFTLKKAS
jgi:two-component system phosphate regulon sensor histidine kinase PhoR